METLIRFDDVKEEFICFVDSKSVFPLGTVASVEFVKPASGKDFTLKVTSRAGETKLFGRSTGELANAAVAEQISSFLEHDLTDK